jgi:hypothetical protein
MCGNVIIWNGIDVIVLLVGVGVVLICGIVLGLTLLKETIKEKRKK